MLEAQPRQEGLTLHTRGVNSLIFGHLDMYLGLGSAVRAQPALQQSNSKGLVSLPVQQGLRHLLQWCANLYRHTMRISTIDYP